MLAVVDHKQPLAIAEGLGDHVDARHAGVLRDLERVFLWSSIPDDELLDLAHPREAERSDRSGAAGPPHTRGSPRVDARRQFREPVAVSPRPPRRGAGHAGLPRLRRQPARGLPAGDAALPRESAARGSQRRRSVAGGLYVRQRAPGAVLRIPNLYGTHFRRVKMTDPRRRGLLGHGSLLTSPRTPIARRR